MNQSQSPDKSDAEILDSLRESAQENLRFFSNEGREARERWVVSEFLARQKMIFAEEELHSRHQSSKTDVEFRDANFQVKEILNPRTKRHEEIKANYDCLLAATNLRDIKWRSFIYDIPQISTIYNLVAAKANSLSIKSNYIIAKANLDLLFYVTRTYASLIQKNEIDSRHLREIGWRSISCLAGNQAIVLFASSHAPAFLRQLQIGG